MKKLNQLLPFLAVGMLAAPLVAQAEYDYESFNYPGSTLEQVYGINNRGDVAGNGIVGADNFPYVYDSKRAGSPT